MTIRLRPHHLLCLQTYVGQGYTPAFVAGFDQIAARLDSGEAIVLIAGPDDLCAPICDGPGAHCRKASVTARDVAALNDLAAWLAPSALAGHPFVLTSAMLGWWRAAFATRAIRAACVACPWDELCTVVSHRGFTGTSISGCA